MPTGPPWPCRVTNPGQRGPSDQELAWAVVFRFNSPLPVGVGLGRRETRVNYCPCWGRALRVRDLLGLPWLSCVRRDSQRGPLRPRPNGRSR
eukprot:8849588-Pyramimonas_sp.AAC.1